MQVVYWHFEVCVPINLFYIHRYSHKLQLQKLEIKKKKKDTHSVSKNTTYQKCILIKVHTNYVQRKLLSDFLLAHPTFKLRWAYVLLLFLF